ncbi:MAG: hypothetical protein ACLFS4_07210 [Opitutales bacterium]
MRWVYERGDHRHKHQWKNDFPGFEPGRKGPIGKCPKHVTEEIAEKALNEGIPFYDTPESVEGENTFPSKIYTVYKGVIYEAAVTTPGISFHAYPWRGDLGRPPLPNSILRELEKKLKTQTEKRTFKKWLRKYSP